MLLAIAAATFIITMVCCLVVYYLLIAERRVVNDRMNTYINMRQPVAAEPLSREGSGQSAWRNLISLAGKWFESPQWTRLIEHKLIQAGLPLRSSEFMAIWTAVGLLGLVGGFIFSGGKPLFALLGGVAGGYGPYLYLRIKIQRRAKAFNDQLGDTLVLMANSLRTGYSFLQAVDMVSREMPPPISLEFGRTLQEMNFGVSTEDAMHNMAKRVDSDDLDLVITVVLIQRQVGGNLAEIMDNIAGTIRERVRIKGQIKTLTAQGRISGLVIGGMPFALALIIYVINPSYMTLLFTTSLGKTLLAGALISEILGALVIRKIIDIEI